MTRGRLFVRKPRGVTLTEEARRLLPEVSRSIDGPRSVAARFAPLASASSLRVATSISVAQWLIVPRLSRFLDDPLADDTDDEALSRTAELLDVRETLVR